MITNEVRKKQAFQDRKRALLVSELSMKYKVTEVFIRLAIKKERQTELAEKILKEYTCKYQELSKIIQQ